MNKYLYCTLRLRLFVIISKLQAVIITYQKKRKKNEFHLQRHNEMVTGRRLQTPKQKPQRSSNLRYQRYVLYADVYSRDFHLKCVDQFDLVLTECLYFIPAQVFDDRTFTPRLICIRISAKTCLFKFYNVKKVLVILVTNIVAYW